MSASIQIARASLIPTPARHAPTSSRSDRRESPTRVLTD